MIKLLYTIVFFFFTQLSFAHNDIKVINGQSLSHSIYPQVVESGDECTVSFIGPRTFVTSAHCVTSDHFEVNGQSAQMYIHPYATDDTNVGSFDIAIGVVKRDQNIVPLSLCLPSESVDLLGESVTQIGFGCSARSGSGGGVKRYNFTQVSYTEEDYIKFDAGSTGAVGCYGDSGGPYLLRDVSKRTSCVLAIHYNSDLKRYNMATNVFYSKVRLWLERIAEKKKLSICGLNIKCPDVYYSL